MNPTAAKWVVSSHDLRGQVDREEILGHQVFIHHVVKDRGCSCERDAREGQTQDSIEGEEVEGEKRLIRAQAKDLVGDLNVSNLQGEMRKLRHILWEKPPWPTRGTYQDGEISALPQRLCFSVLCSLPQVSVAHKWFQ